MNYSSGVVGKRLEPDADRNGAKAPCDSSTFWTPARVARNAGPVNPSACASRSIPATVPTGKRQWMRSVGGPGGRPPSPFAGPRDPRFFLVAFFFGMGFICVLIACNRPHRAIRPRRRWRGRFVLPSICWADILHVIEITETHAPVARVVFPL